MCRSVYVIYGKDKITLAFLGALVSVENLFAYITHGFYLWNVEVFGQCQVHDVPLFLNAIPYVSTFVRWNYQYAEINYIDFSIS